MVRLTLATALLAVTSTAQAIKSQSSTVLPGAYIVEYTDDHVSNLHLYNEWSTNCAW
jgi:hypothetical protein